MSKLDDEAVALLWQLNAQFIHDARNPLFMIRAHAEGISGQWEALVRGYQAAVREGLVADELCPGHLDGMRMALGRIQDDSTTGLELIDGYWEDLKANFPMPEEKWRGNGAKAFARIRRDSGKSSSRSGQQGGSTGDSAKWGREAWFSGGPGEPLSVLLVDDHETNREVATEMLGLLDCRVIVACDGEEAVQMWRKEAPRLVLMDLCLPKLDGIAAVARIRELESMIPKHTPIVGVTASPDDREFEAARAAGMEECIAKPLTVEKLEGVLAKYRF